MTELDHPAPDFPLEHAARLAREHFGVSGELSRLDSERDQNFRLVSDAGDWTFKIVNASEPATESAFQAALLDHLGAVAPDRALPRLRKAASGSTLATAEGPSGARHALRMVSWLSGKPLAESARTPDLLHSLGRMMGRMDRALQGFIHPGALRVLDWDIRRAGESRSRLHHIADPADRALVTRFLDRFDAHVAPRLPALRAQVIHNDANDWNVLVDPDRPSAVVRVIADPADGRLVAPATLGRVRKAVAALTTVAPAVADWAAATGPRTIVLAEPRSFCAGVERAIEVVEQALVLRGAPVYVRKQIVHNQHVVGDLAARGAVFVDDLDDVPTGATVVFSAHGVSPGVRDQARQRGLDVIDATCPLVTKVHTEVRRFADRGDTIVFIGHAGHEETEGTMGERPESTVLVQDLADAESVRVPDPERCSYLVQTTLSAYEVAGIIEVLRRRFPAIKGPATDDICYATTNRQDALRDVAGAAELVLVVGSQNSSNSRRLVETAQRFGAAAYLVDDLDGVDLRWLAGVSTVGITAGASAPAALGDEVVGGSGGLGPIEVHTRRLVTENVHFTLPKEVRGA